jgi:hypothetical protein
MAVMNLHPVVGVFPNRGKAEVAVDQLEHAGFRHDQIGIGLPGGAVGEAKTKTGDLEDRAAKGAVVGAVGGGVVGAMTGGATVAMLPEIESIMASSLMAGMGAAAGAAIGCYVGPFIALGTTKREVRTAEKADSERTVLVIKAEDRPRQAAMILRNYGALSVQMPEEDERIAPEEAQIISEAPREIEMPPLQSASLANLGIFALVFGILGVTFWWWVPTGMILSLAGMILGLVAWTVRDRTAGGLGVLISGLVVSLAALLFNLLVAAFHWEIIRFTALR